MANRHLIIPDTQVKPGVPLDHFDWAAKAIIEYRPTHVIHLGDHWDMHSLSKHAEPGSLEMEGLRYSADVDAGNEAFARLVHPLKKYKFWSRVRKHYLFGNHEYRISRATSDAPKLIGTMSLDHLETPGFQRHDFLHVVNIDDVAYSHYYANPLNGRPMGGSARALLPKLSTSFVQGHRQGLDYGSYFTPTGRSLHGLIAGSYYQHSEGYMGPQADPHHWRGLVVLNGVERGDFDLMPLRLSYLKTKYGRKH
jgi:hypothetical protein